MGYSKAKWPILGRNLKVPKSQQKGLQKHIKVVLCRKRLEKTPNVRKMKGFRKVAKMAISAWAIVRQNGLFWDGI